MLIFVKSLFCSSIFSVKSISFDSSTSIFLSLISFFSNFLLVFVFAVRTIDLSIIFGFRPRLDEIG